MLNEWFTLPVFSAATIIETPAGTRSDGGSKRNSVIWMTSAPGGIGSCVGAFGTGLEAATSTVGAAGMEVIASGTSSDAVEAT